MDETDIRLCQLLLQNSRAPYRELADKLDISVQAVHRRIQVLMEMRVISNFHASLSLGFLGAVNVIMFGTSESKSIEEVILALKESDRIHRVLKAASNYLVVESFLQDISELETHLDFVKKAAQIPNITLGIVGTAQFGTTPLNKKPPEKIDIGQLDYQILVPLQRDSRIPVADIAEETGLSARTVKKRLDRMVEENVVEFGFTWHPGFSGGTTAVLILNLRPGTDKMVFRSKMIEHFGARLVYLTTFSNQPDILLSVIYCATVMQYNEMVETFSKLENVDRFVSHILQFGHEFESWRDRMIKERALKKA